MRDPADIGAQRIAEAAIDAVTNALEIDIFTIVVERLAVLDDMGIIDIYASMPEDVARINRELEQGSKRIQNVTRKTMQDMARANDEWARTYYEASGMEQVSTLNHQALSKTLETATKAATTKIAVMCRSSVFAIGNDRFAPIGEGYKRIVSRAASEMAAGEITGQQAVKNAVKSMVNNGLRVMYRSGVTRNLHTAVRTNVMDAYRTAMTEMREIQGKEFGADGVEVSAHALCAPDHRPYQGMRYPYKSRPDYRYTWDEVQNLPARPLVTGANCGHTVYPVLLGVSSPAYSRQEINELNRKSKEEVTFKGLGGKDLTMSRYDASQYQRQLETTIRKQKEEAYLLRQSGQDASAANKAARRYSSEYKRISGEAGLTPRMENTRIFTNK